MDLQKFIKHVAIALFIIYVLSGIYSISSNEVGVILRFGKIIESEVQPGIHYSLPWPVDTIKKVPVKLSHRIVIDDFFPGTDPGSASSDFYKKTGLVSYCITGDNNIVNIECVIQYNISDPVKYLFYVTNACDILYHSTANAIIHCISRLDVDKVLTYGKKEMEDYIRFKLRGVLDMEHSGLNVTAVEIKNVRPPSKVQQFFDDVINAKIDRNKVISQAESYRNEEISKAESKANRLKTEAESYKKKTIMQAQGETERFKNKLKVYKSSTSITRKQIYLEFLKTIMPYVEIIVSEPEVFNKN
ncbi:MAG: FtsH protease activity modulator HflK [Candidatus Hydrogenedentota bacterium]